MAECNDHENCAAKEEIQTNSQLEKELSKNETDYKKRGFRLMNQLKQIKQLDEQIYKKQMAMHLPRYFVAQNNAADPQVEQDPSEQTTQNHVDQMIANFEHKIRKATKEENDEGNKTKDEKQISETDFGNCAAESINNVCSFRWSKSKNLNNECSSGFEELSLGGIDNEDNLTTAGVDFESKKLHFEKLIQRDIIITEQEINRRQKLLKKWLIKA